MKRILKLFTNRLVQTGISILVQFVIIILISIYINEVFVWYYLFSLVLGIILSIVVINSKANAGYKMAWTLVLLAVPMFGASIFLVLNGRYFTKVKRKKMRQISNRVKEILSHEERTEIDKVEIKGQSDYISHFSYSPPVKNTKGRYFDSGEEYFKALLDDLSKANKSIYLEYFIIRRGYMWDEIKKVLIQKAREGIEIKIIYDDMGSIDNMTKKERRMLEKEGIKIKPFNLFLPFLDLSLNNRDHRKICTIDSKIAYTGGINLSDEYINRKSRFGHWKDVGIALYGEGAYVFEVFFLSMWEHITKERIVKKKPCYEECDNGIFQPYMDSPIDNEQVGENIYLNMISSAKKYVYISTPYFIVDDEMLRTITNASKRGVDVRIILPKNPDKKITNQVTKSHYNTLIESGVKIYEYDGFNHAKLVVVDGEVATVGSVNFDYRSFYLSFECGVWMYNTEIIGDILNDFFAMQSKSLQISQNMCRVNIFTKILRAIASTFAPML